MTARSVPFAETWRALSKPRRLVPIVGVSLSLVVTEWLATRSLDAVVVLLAFVFGFALLVPPLARWYGGSGARLVGYIVACTILVGLASSAPYLLLYESYVLHAPAAVAIVVLTGMAGWVLARDIDLESGLLVEQRRSDLLRREGEDARLVAIRQHLDPHFLFNTLGAIAEWCREDPLVAEKALIDLSGMLRTLFVGLGAAEWPLERELEILRSLHELYRLRDDERYVLQEAVHAPGDNPVPPLLLLPLFENALTHGTGEAPTRLEMRVDTDVVYIRIWNSGQMRKPGPDSSGIETTRRRLALHYGAGVPFEVVSETLDGVEGTSATLRIPLRREA